MGIELGREFSCGNEHSSPVIVGQGSFDSIAEFTS
jgi:hypothetical protein